MRDFSGWHIVHKKTIGKCMSHLNKPQESAHGKIDINKIIKFMVRDSPKSSYNSLFAYIQPVYSGTYIVWLNRLFVRVDKKKKNLKIEILTVYQAVLM